MPYRINLPKIDLIGSLYRYPGLTTDSAEIRGNATAVALSFASGVSGALTVTGIPSSFLIDGITYTSVTDPTLLTGNTFLFNPTTRQITLSQPVTTSGTAYVRASAATYTQAALQLMGALGKYHCLSISISRQWAEQPSASVSFRVPVTLRAAVLENLRPGHTTQILDIGLQVSNLSLREIPASKSNVREVEVNVEFEGSWSGEKLRAQPYLDPSDAQLSPVNYAIGYSDQVLLNGPQTPATTTLQRIASRSGTPLLFPETQVNVPRTGFNELMDWASELTSIAERAESFVYWSSPSGIQLTPWESVQTHTISESQILSEISARVPRAARDLPGTALASFRWQTIGVGPATSQVPRLNPTTYTAEGPYRKIFEWEGAKVEVASGTLFRAESEGSLYQLGNEVETSNPDTRTRWRRRNRAQEVVESGSSDVPLWAINLKETTVNFDVTGYTQSKVRTWTLDGSPVREQVSVYGFAFTAKDLEDAGGSLPASDYWIQIESKDTTYYRDTGTGYYLGYDTRGWRKTRYAQENSKDPETLTAEGPELDLFGFVTLPFTESQGLVLAQLSDYYQTDSFQDYSFAVDDQGNQVLQQDPNYTEPMFVILEETTSFAAELVPNPVDEELPPLVAGRESVTTRTVKPRTTYQSRANLDLTALTGQDIEDQSQNEFYIEVVNNYSSEGAGFDGVAQDDSTTFQQGRPGEAERLPPQYTQQSDSQRDQAIVTNSYHLFSQGYDDTPRGTASFGSVTEETLRKAARSQLYLNNLSRGYSESFSVVFSPQIKEGDKINLFVNGVYRKRRVQSVSHEIKIDGSINLRASQTQLSLVRDPGYPDPVFDVFLRPDVKPQASFRLFRPHYAGRTLRKPVGRNSGLTSRYNL